MKITGEWKKLGNGFSRLLKILVKIKPMKNICKEPIKNKTGTIKENYFICFSTKYKRRHNYVIYFNFPRGTMFILV